MAIKEDITGIEAVYNNSGKNTLLIEVECSENPEGVLKELYISHFQTRLNDLSIVEYQNCR